MNNQNIAPLNNENMYPKEDRGGGDGGGGGGGSSSSSSSKSSSKSSKSKSKSKAKAPATAPEVMRSSSGNVKKTSKYNNVSYDVLKKVWVVKLCINGKRLSKKFGEEVDAAEQYDSWIRFYNLANKKPLNFPTDLEKAQGKGGKCEKCSACRDGLSCAS